ncbi:MAG: hypothetical protein QW286_02800, partial [Candidatus Aenigmatarchaeota archaeon]
MEKPPARFLPVDPTDIFPLEAIKEVAAAKKFDTSPYFTSVGSFDVLLLTPMLKYRIQTEAERKAAKTRTETMYQSVMKRICRNALIYLFIILY